jgi:excisionase family DNA binding protein
MARENIYTLQEVAEWLKVTDQSVRRWIKDGKLSAYKLGHDWRIAESDVLTFLEERRTGRS